MGINKIAGSARIGSGFKIGDFCIVGEHVVIGDNVTIGNGVIIHNDTRIGSNVTIQDNAVIGKGAVRAKNSVANIIGGKDGETAPAIIMDNCIIGTSSILYRGCTLHNDCYIADLATVRENVVIGEGTIVGRGVCIENCCDIGKMCKIETNAYITAFSRLEDYVFIAPGVITTNDNYLGRTSERYSRIKGVTVKRGGRIGGNSTILPGKVIESDALVGAGSIVTKDVPAGTVVKGNPAVPYKTVPEKELLKNNL
ncbi:MAG: N-acetyltransferase [Clostridiales bacterium]|nr:N-acetyltransferase [Clostridiales bacterium]